MSRYDEICAVASDAREQWIAKKDRCYQAINSLLFGLRDYCTIPDEQILYLRWNGYKDGAFSLPGDGSKYTLLGAIEYSEDDDESRKESKTHGFEFEPDPR